MRTENILSRLSEINNDISTNTTNIATNTANIATNTADIATNVVDIATNISDIVDINKWYFNPIQFPFTHDWHFNEMDGTVAYDFGQDTNNGTIVSCTINQTGKMNRSYLFDGTNDYVEIADQLSTRCVTDCSISVWIKPTAWETSGGRIIHKGTDIFATNGYQLIYEQANARLNLIINNVQILYSANNSIVLGNWHHLVLVMSSNAGIGKQIWIDGFLSNSNNNVNMPPNVAGIVRWGTLANAVDANRSFIGYMERGSFANKILSQQEILNLYNSGNGTLY